MGITSINAISYTYLKTSNNSKPKVNYSLNNANQAPSQISFCGCVTVSSTKYINERTAIKSLLKSWKDLYAEINGNPNSYISKQDLMITPPKDVTGLLIKRNDELGLTISGILKHIQFFPNLKRIRLIINSNGLTQAVSLPTDKEIRKSLIATLNQIVKSPKFNDKIDTFKHLQEIFENDKLREGIEGFKLEEIDNILR